MNKQDLSPNQVSLELLRNGDRDEFARFVEFTSPAIYGLALRMLNNPQDAEDVLQETYIKAMRAISSFEGRSSLTTWLYRIAINEALMLTRKQKMEIPLEEEPDEDDGEPAFGRILADWGSLPEDLLLNEESKKFINQAVGDLPLKLRMVFILRDIQGLSIKETAEALEISETNVKIRLMRARLKMRDALSGYYQEWMREGKA